jgi:hypothetical protein
MNLGRTKLYRLANALWWAQSLGRDYDLLKNSHLLQQWSDLEDIIRAEAYKSSNPKGISRAVKLAAKERRKVGMMQ